MDGTTCVVFTLLICIVGVNSDLTCYCYGSGAQPDAECTVLFPNGTIKPLFECTTDSNGLCYTQRSLWDGELITKWGCQDVMGSTPSNTITAWCSTRTETNAIQCCNGTDKCNHGLHPLLLFETLSSSLHVSSTSSSVELVSTPPQPEKSSSEDDIYLSLTIGLPIALVFILALTIITLTVVICHLRYRKKRLEANRRLASPEQEMYPHNYDLDSMEMNELTCTSGSGSGLPFLIQRTVARSIKIGDPIGNGRYGQVFVGYYQGDRVAVKKFASRDEQSWFRETEIYNTVLLRHDNILGFFASDMTSNNGVTELWLITQYHPNGSLYDYLNRECVQPQVLLRMAISMCSGLAHMHTELFGTQAKPAIAHRDIKSKNILVKGNLSCCIADFGLAVVKETGTNGVNVPMNPKQGTKRYMAPEILNDSLNINYFESFKQADIYSLGLVVWELCKMCIDSKVPAGEEPIYELPFQGLVPPDPSFKDMKRLVVIERRQPAIPNRWHNDELLRDMTKIMRECWYYNSSARPTAVYLKKKLMRFYEEENKMSYSDHE